jgi:hypothetical protein
MRAYGYVLGLVLATGALIVVDRIGTADDSGQVSLLVLLVGAAALGFAVPRLAWLSGLVIGAALAATNAVYMATGHTWSADSEPGGWAGAALMLVLVVPALIAAYLGAGAHWLLRRTRDA